MLLMVPGWAQAIEGGAAPAVLLKAMLDDFADALRRYQEVRKLCAAPAGSSEVKGTCSQPLGGPKRQKRDEVTASSGDRSIANIAWLNGYDAAGATSALKDPSAGSVIPLLFPGWLGIAIDQAVTVTQTSGAYPPASHTLRA